MQKFGYPCIYYKNDVPGLLKGLFPQIQMTVTECLFCYWLIGNVISIHLGLFHTIVPVSPCAEPQNKQVYILSKMLLRPSKWFFFLSVKLFFNNVTIMTTIVNIIKTALNCFSAFLNVRFIESHSFSFSDIVSLNYKKKFPKVFKIQ